MSHRAGVLRVVLALALALALGGGAPAASAVALCDSTSKGLVPLTELGAGTYLGQAGGLYPGGTNAMPAAHLADGLARAQAITALDTLGHPAANGRIVVLSVGMSNTTQEYSTFVPLANASPVKNPRVLLVDGAQGGQTAAVFADPDAAPWAVIETRLRNMGVRAAQVQAVWLKEANAGPTQGFPGAAQILRDDLRAVVQNLHAKFPNLKLCYLSSRIYAGYASTALNPEPYAYESGFAVRWLIEEQLDGSPALNADPDAGPVRAPWLAWGPYLWADGVVPRAADGLTWECGDFNSSDGTHPAETGRAKVAQMLLDFFTRDPTAEPWFTNRLVGAGAGVGPGSAAGSIAVSASPNPSAGGDVAIECALATAAADADVAIFDLAGRRVRQLHHGALPAGTSRFAWDGRDEAGRAMPSGLYFARVRADGASGGGKVLRLQASGGARGL